MNKTIPQEQIRQSHILVVGDMMLDRYWFGDVERISPEAPVPVVQVKRSDERLGGAANVARNAAALGARVDSDPPRRAPLAIEGEPRTASRRRPCVERRQARAVDVDLATARRDAGRDGSRAQGSLPSARARDAS